MYIYMYILICVLIYIRIETTQISTYTPPKTNMAPENRPLWKEIPAFLRFQPIVFFGTFGLSPFAFYPSSTCAIAAKPHLGRARVVQVKAPKPTHQRPFFEAAGAMSVELGRFCCLSHPGCFFISDPLIWNTPHITGYNPLHTLDNQMSFSLLMGDLKNWFHPIKAKGEIGVVNMVENHLVI